MPTIATALRTIATKSRIASSLPPSFADKSLVAMTLANGPAPDCAALHPDLRQLPDRACSPHERSDMRVRYVRKPVPDIASLIRASSRTERLQNQPESPTSSLTSEFHCGALARRYRRPSSRVGRSTNTRGHDLMARQGPLVSPDWRFRPPSVGRIIGGGRGVSFIFPASTSIPSTIPRRSADVLSNPRSRWRRVLRHDQRLQQACSGMACAATAPFYKGILVAGLSRGKAGRVRWSCALRADPKHRIPEALLR